MSSQAAPRDVDNPNWTVAKAISINATAGEGVKRDPLLTKLKVWDVTGDGVLASAKVMMAAEELALETGAKEQPHHFSQRLSCAAIILSCLLIMPMIGIRKSQQEEMPANSGVMLTQPRNMDSTNAEPEPVASGFKKQAKGISGLRRASKEEFDRLDEINFFHDSGDHRLKAPQSYRHDGRTEVACTGDGDKKCDEHTCWCEESSFSSGLVAVFVMSSILGRRGPAFDGLEQLMEDTSSSLRQTRRLQSVTPSPTPVEEDNDTRNMILWGTFGGLAFIALCMCLVSAGLKYRRHHPPQKSARDARTALDARDVAATPEEQPGNVKGDDRVSKTDPNDVSNNLPPLDPDLPVELHVESPNQQRACAGIYDLVPARRAHGRAVWHKRGDMTPRWLYTGNDGLWYIGGPLSEQRDFQCNSGYICHTSRDCSRPDLVDGPWLWGDSADWSPDPAIVVKPATKGELLDGCSGPERAVSDALCDDQEGTLRKTSQPGGSEADAVSGTNGPAADSI